MSSGRNIMCERTLTSRLVREKCYYENACIKIIYCCFGKISFASTALKHYYRKPNRSKNFEFEIYRREIKFLMAEWHQSLWFEKIVNPSWENFGI